MKTVRTRFAVSPTGFMHVGGVRNALFDWLLARQSGGQFILRIEDTDQAREVKGAVNHIIKTLQWLKLDWQEGPDIGGPYEPYTQSKRLDIYKEWSQKLIDAGRAYGDPYSQEEVQAFREAAQKAKQPFLYRNHRPKDPPKWDGSQPLRFKSDPKPYNWHDEVLGDLHAGPEAVDDFILIKSDGFATYNFCHVVDDHLMKISHIIRSQEFIASVPKYLNLYEALGISSPIMATLPFIMAPDGKKKLSKRDGAKDIRDYALEGYLPEAMLNFLATLGWNDGTEQEIFSVPELIEKFDLGRVQRGGAKFDEQRLLWLNGAHIRALSLDDLYARSTDFWSAAAKEASDTYKKQVLALVQERLKYLSELPELTHFFFSEPTAKDVTELLKNPTDKQLKKIDPAEYQPLLAASLKSLETSDFSLEDLTKRLNQLLEDLSTKPGILFALLRIALTGSTSSPPIAETMVVLGKDKSLDRLSKTEQLLG